MTKLRAAFPAHKYMAMAKKNTWPWPSKKQMTVDAAVGRQPLTQQFSIWNEVIPRIPGKNKIQGWMNKIHREMKIWAYNFKPNRNWTYFENNFIAKTRLKILWFLKIILVRKQDPNLIECLNIRREQSDSDLVNRKWRINCNCGVNGVWSKLKG